MSIPRRTFLLAAFLLALLHGWMAASVSGQFSPVYDETAHIVAGASYWREHDYRLQPENGLFPQLWAALPLVVDSKLHYPSLEQPIWIGADVWNLGDQFLHRTGNDTGRILQRSRAMIAVLGGALVFLITLWAASLFGACGGLVAGVLACFSPTLLAHAGLVTSDTAGALGYTVAILAWWRLCHRISPVRIIVAGLTLALLALSKYSVALFPLVVALLLAVRMTHPAVLPTCGRALVKGWRRLPVLLGAGCLASLLAYGVIWSAYGFRYAARGPAVPPSAGFIVDWPKALIETPLELSFTMADGQVPENHTVIMKPGPVQRVVAFAARHRLLPEAWLYGLTFVDRYSRCRLAYFAGDWSVTGWLAFFPVAYLLKSTPSELVLHAAAVSIVLGGLRLSPARRRILYRASPLLAGILVYTVFALTTKLNIGHRHLLPIYALAAVLAGGAILPALAARHGRRWLIAVVLGLLVFHIGCSWQIRPHYLAYFNLLAGGPDGGNRYLVDSSLDWGQNLPALQTWREHNGPHRPLHLSYFGNGNPESYGLIATRIGDAPFDYTPARQVVPELQPGLFAISATMWQRVYTQVRGPWSASYEQRYQRLMNWVIKLNDRDPKTPLTDADNRLISETELPGKLGEFEQLRFGRLLAFLRNRPPQAIVAHTWFVFDLDEAALNTALYGLVPVEKAN